MTRIPLLLAAVAGFAFASTLPAAPTTRPSLELTSLHESSAFKSATEVLREALIEHADEPDALRQASTKAADLLEGHRNADRLDQVADLPDERLADAVRAMLVRISFKPINEASTPPGWPEPTVVGEIELKRYPEHRLARAVASGGRQNGLFWSLFRHIESNDIPMTAPVEMTGPAARDRGNNGGQGPAESTMAFLYPDMETGSLGSDGTVEVVDVEPVLAVSIGVRGNLGGRTVEQAGELLRAWIADRPDLREAGPLRVMGYSSPMIPRNLRYSEIQIPVEPVAEAAAE
jgi:hypothetical protein